MKFSILIPYYNKGIETLERCLNSIKAQDKKLLKETTVFILDDHSDEVLDIESITSKYDFTIYYVRNTRNMGLFCNRLEGFKTAVDNSDYYINLDCDDELDPKALSTFYNILSQTAVDILQFEIKTNPPDGIGPSSYLNNYNSTKDILLAHKFLFGSMCDKVFSNSIINIILSEFKDEHVYINMMEDMVFTLSYFGKDKKYRHIDDALYIYNVEEETSISNNDNVTDTSRYILSVLKELIPRLHIIPECIPEIKSYIYRIMNYSNPALTWEVYDKFIPLQGERIIFE